MDDWIKKKVRELAQDLGLWPSGESKVDNALRDVRKRTIEECAKVADKHYAYSCNVEIAEAIRRLGK